MSEPTPATRAVTYERDKHRCVSCGSYTNLQYQHRQATGMGGSLIRPLFVDGVTSCARCNPRYESDLQRSALRFGWKVRSWVEMPGRVPVWCVWERCWYRLTKGGTRELISPKVAIEMMTEIYGEEYKTWMS